MEAPSHITLGTARSWDRPLVVVPVLVLLSAVGARFPSFSLEANLYLLAIGGTLMWLGLSGRVPRRPPPVRLSRRAAWWLVPALTLALIELVMFIGGSTYDYPTLSLLADPVLESYLARAACYLGWLAGFWGLVHR
jgi:hypothetical protein